MLYPAMILIIFSLILWRTLYIFISTIKEHDHCAKILTKLKDNAT
uniref:Bm13177, isoform a n=1 Tax=Brugia malayi TaxID=6279 RepID=A0A1I9G280_BRUMA|nr:Bm13177, isoform a [Brugia malayi]